MLQDSHKKIILSTVPLLRTDGIVLTKYFYNRMFTHHPELKNIFNTSNQQNDKQQTALAMAVLAYAENIANPGVLMPVVDMIGHKHSSLNIQPEQYAIVGEHLIASIQEVLGDLATTEVVEAWQLAYQALADLMIGHEQKIYRDKETQPHSWTGWKQVVVTKKIAESDEITSFYLALADGAPLPAHRPGQYLSVQVYLPELQLYQSRQYSISSMSNGESFRISVKKERGFDANPNGQISNFLHREIQVGDTLNISAPAGNFTLQNNPRNKVFISGGIGQTPLIAMLESLVSHGDSTPKITWIHGCRNRAVQAFNDRVQYIQDNCDQVEAFVFYDVKEAGVHPSILEGQLDLSRLNNWSLDTDADYYICGPGPFIEKHFHYLVQENVSEDRIFFEEFGPQTLQLN
ncbi:NO-inducible flavohemoprotein [Flavobacterium sp. JP2137]|uniref:NO-inducible flavohemoprotein n=1 Tax=Flavobacterium sp. JP2137 TaxID=3414510 RepID=UPI003D2FED4B